MGMWFTNLLRLRVLKNTGEGGTAKNMILPVLKIQGKGGREKGREGRRGRGNVISVGSSHREDIIAMWQTYCFS